jgi:hypothetical protein
MPFWRVGAVAKAIPTAAVTELIRIRYIILLTLNRGHGKIITGPRACVVPSNKFSQAAETSLYLLVLIY